MAVFGQKLATMFFEKVACLLNNPYICKEQYLLGAWRVFMPMST